MKRLLFMVVVTLVVLASFDRPQKEDYTIRSSASGNPGSQYHITDRDSTAVVYKK